MNYLVAIVGPTATGKSHLALLLAKAFSGEIVSADSRQVYRHMDIGTAKPGRDELALVPHHMIDVVNPDDDFSLAQYQHLAQRVIADVQGREKAVFLVGGSGLYVWSVLEGWGIPSVPPDAEFRRHLEERAAAGEDDELYGELGRADPAAAQGIDPRNVRRVIRALEVSHHAAAPFSRLRQKQGQVSGALIIGLTANREELYRRVDLRVDRMVERGLVEEVRRLVRRGYGFDLPAMSGIGYKQIGMFLRGEASLDSAVQQIKFATHRFVRQQYNWFKLNDERIKWFDIMGDGVETEIAREVDGFLSA